MKKSANNRFAKEKNQYLKIIKNNKGINMITLSIAVIILVIITSVLVYNAKDGVKIKTLSNMYNDIETLENKVSSYYLEHGDIPGHIVYANESDGINSEFINMIKNAGVLNPNDENTYLIIDLKSLEGISLNYGRDYDKVSDNSDVTSLKDLYVINKVSHTIYYPRGIQVEGTTYYTTQEEYTKLDKATIPIYTAQEMSWVGDGQSHAIEEEDGTEYTFALNGTYILKNDIDLSGVCSAELSKNWNPIGTESAPFTGTFYGNGHEIKNLYINIDKANNSKQGLFRYIKNATLQDFNVTGTINSTNASGPYTYMGGIIAIAHQKCSIKNVYNKVNVYCSMTGYGSVGGILAVENNDGEVTIENCYNSGHLIGGNSTGGIIGDATKIVQIKDCYNIGQIEKGQYLGGIIRIRRWRQNRN